MPHRRVRANAARQTVCRSLITDRSLESIIGGKVKVQSDGCWIWQGTMLGDYGHHAKAGYIHRFVWSTLRGEIPEGMVVHHHCRVTACCNPDHLELLEHGDHTALHNRERRAS